MPQTSKQTSGSTQKRTSKRKTKRTSPAARTSAWLKAVQDSSEDFREFLDDEKNEDVVLALSDNVHDLVHEGDPIGQRILAAGKRNPYTGNAMAALEASSLVREGIRDGKDIYAGGKWVVGKVAGLFGR